MSRFFLPAICFIAFLSLLSAYRATATDSATSVSTAPPLPHAHIHPLLHHQSLSHLSLHSSPFQLYLASLFTSKAIAIVGVEWGSDLRHFASSSFRVHAVEPATKFLTHLRAEISANPHWDVTLHPFAAGNISGPIIQINYGNENVVENVTQRRLDDMLREHLAVLTVDIQGDELYVLQGASALLPASVDSLWIEAGSCNPKVAHILDMLDQHYVLFDFVPWGSNRHHPMEKVPRSYPSFAFDSDRPSPFTQYLDWMCDIRKRDYRWLQTDLLAVRRDLIGKVWHNLATLAQTQCPKHGVNCLFRSLQATGSSIDSSEREEL